MLSVSVYKKLSCRREIARCFVSSNISLSHSSSFETFELSRPTAVSCIISEIKRDIGQKSRFFPRRPCIQCPFVEGYRRNIAITFDIPKLQGGPKSDEISHIFRPRPQTFCSHARTRQNIVILKKTCQAQMVSLQRMPRLVNFGLQTPEIHAPQNS